jgi:hypothetical protein
MKLTQEQAEKLKTLKTMEEVNAFFKTERIQLDPEDLDKIDGGWNFFDPVKNAYKSVGNWMYDNLIDPAVDGVVYAGKAVAGGAVDAGEAIADVVTDAIGLGD